MSETKKNEISVDEITKIIEDILLDRAPEIDEISGSKGVEKSYLDLEKDCILKLFANMDIIDKSKEPNRERREYRWLGERDYYINKTVGDRDLREDNFNIDLLKKKLKEYCNKKLEWTKQKKEALDKTKELFHGSIDKNIEEFEPRAKTGGDKEKLVYMSDDKDYCKCYIFDIKNVEQRISKDDKIVTFSPKEKEGTLTIKDIMLNSDVGGCLYVAKDEEKNKFGVAMSKSDHEFCSIQCVKPSEKVYITSTLNELLINTDYKVNFKEKSSSKEFNKITLNELLKQREEICKDSNYTEIEIIKKQQKDAIKLIKSKIESLKSEMNSPNCKETKEYSEEIEKLKKELEILENKYGKGNGIEM